MSLIFQLLTNTFVDLFAAAMLLPIVMCSLLVSLVQSHAIWSFPTPRYAGTDKLKAWPCGVGLTNDWKPETPVTDIQPGKQRLRFTETINHQGAPFRVALSFNTDSEYSMHVLLDHIPHNDAIEQTPKEYVIDVSLKSIG